MSVVSGGVGSDTFVSDWCRIVVGLVSDVSGGVGSDTFVSDWCRMCRVVSDPTHLCQIGVGLVSDWCRIGVGVVSDVSGGVG